MKFLRIKDTISDVVDKLNFYERKVFILQRAIKKHFFSIKNRKQAILKNILPSMAYFIENYFMKKANPDLKALSFKICCLDTNILKRVVDLYFSR